MSTEPVSSPLLLSRADAECVPATPLLAVDALKPPKPAADSVAAFGELHCRLIAGTYFCAALAPKIFQRVCGRPLAPADPGNRRAHERLALFLRLAPLAPRCAPRRARPPAVPLDPARVALSLPQ